MHAKPTKILKSTFHVLATVVKIAFIYLAAATLSYFAPIVLKFVQNEWLFLVLTGCIMGLVAFALITSTGVIGRTKGRFGYYILVAILSPFLLVGFYAFLSRYFTESFYIPMHFVIACTSMIAAIGIGICDPNRYRAK